MDENLARGLVAEAQPQRRRHPEGRRLLGNSDVGLYALAALQLVPQV